MASVTAPQNALIAAVLEAAVEGTFKLFSEQPGYCLRVVRECVQKATGWDYGGFYSLLTHRVEGNETGAPWARSLQRSLRMAGCAVPYDLRRRGLVVANHRLGYPIGHIALIVSRDEAGTWVLENTASGRGRQIDGYNRLSRLEDWPHVNAVEIFDLEKLGERLDQPQI